MDDHVNPVFREDAGCETRITIGSVEAYRKDVETTAGREEAEKSLKKLKEDYDVYVAANQGKKAQIDSLHNDMRQGRDELKAANAKLRKLKKHFGEAAFVEALGETK